MGLAVVVALAAPAVARADAFLSPGLAERAAAQPNAAVRVIVQGEDGKKSAAVGSEVAGEVRAHRGKARGLGRSFRSISGVSAELTGRQILALARRKGILSITVDEPVQVTSDYSSNQLWPYVSGVAAYWPLLSSSGSGSTGSGPQAPTIAVVDSGIQAGRSDFDGRVVAQVTSPTLASNSAGDGRGHGTFVASIAAGGAEHYAGGAPNARLVSIDVIDDNGMGVTSDVIAAADWILQNKSRYGIRVANFSLHGSQLSTFRFDPLCKAVERLWFSGVVVVTAAGNYREQQPGVLFAPANDPFVITVGAQDLAGTLTRTDDFAAPWSSYGSTPDGFRKPELSAPGRYMVGAVPRSSTFALERPDRIVEDGYMLMSGTSFAAPVVSGAAAYILALHPSWTPDQVKGALMLTARHTPLSPPFASGVGEIFAPAAAMLTNPPNPNLALNQFLVADPAGGAFPVFDEATWTSAALANPTWDAATWTSATWTSATWTSAAWDAATWTSATWTSATWTSATWTSATWTSATWTSSAEDETNGTGGDWITSAERDFAEAELGIPAGS